MSKVHVADAFHQPSVLIETPVNIRHNAQIK